MEQFKYDRTPGLCRGLKLAETGQLSMDYQTSPEAFEQVVIFAGKYVDERELLSEELVKHQTLVENLNKNQLVYFELFDQVGNLQKSTTSLVQKIESPRVLGVAHGAAGAYMLDLRKEMNQSHENFLEITDGFSVLLAEYCQKRLDGKDLTIMGRKFDYKLGFLTCQVQENPSSGRIVPKLYGSHKRFLTIRQNMIVRTDKTPPMTHANANDWAVFLYNLDLMTKF